MIQQVMAEEDRAQRNKQAQAIIGIMGNLNPHLRDVADFQHKLWDQLFIMSEFELDVDSPYPIPLKEVLSARPEPLSYPQNFPKYRFYGNNIKTMIEAALKFEDGQEKEALFFVIANHMKKCYLNWNKDTVDDQAIFDHLEELSGGVLKLTPKEDKLTDSEEILKNRINRPAKPQARKNHRNNRSKKK